MKDGWLHSGDICLKDEGDYVYYVDRIKDMINRGGENVYPREVEMAIETHPKVREVSVIGIPDPALTEQVKAYIILNEKDSLTNDELNRCQYLVHIPANPDYSSLNVAMAIVSWQALWQNRSYDVTEDLGSRR